MAVSVVSFSFSRTAQPEAQGLSFLLSAGFLCHILSPTGLRNYWGAPWAPSAGSGFPYHILSATHHGPQLIRAPRVPSAGLSLPHLINNFYGPQLSDFLSSESYIIFQRPLNLWNGMFDRHQAEITVMQFTGHFLPVHHSVATQWDLHLVPNYQPSSPARFLSINGHWDVSLPLSLEWHACPGRRSKYNSCGTHTRVGTQVTDCRYVTNLQFHIIIIYITCNVRMLLLFCYTIKQIEILGTGL